MRFCAPQTETQKFNEHFLSGTNGVYIESLYESWKSDPTSVMAEWDVYFSNVEEGLSPKDSYDFVSSEISHSATLVGSPVDEAQEKMNWHLKIQ